MIKSVMVDGAEALKLMIDGKVVWERGGLPAGYQKCAFLQSDGNQYLSIDDYIPQIGDSFSTDFVATGDHSDSITVFSAGTGDYQLVVMGLISAHSIYMKYFTSGVASSYPKFVAREEPYSMRFSSDGKIIINGTELNGELSKVKMPVNTNLFLFIRANLRSGFVGKILGFKSERNGNVIHSLVPCIDADGVPCMYDTVSKRPFYNQGTGEFIYELE